MEAVDLGLSLLQAHWKPVAAVWGLQVFLLLALFLPFLFRTPLWTLVGLWWLKPWLDRGILFVLSRVVFGQSATLWDFLREWRRLHRRGLVASLLWRRLSPMRSYVLPVSQLEGLRGATYRNRARVLTRQSGGTAFLLTCSGLIFTLLTLVGFLALLQGMLLPGSRVQVWAGFKAMAPGFQWFLLALSLLVLTLTEPLFVAGGFGLYLNRRTHLEGWDLELAFRRLAARLALVFLLVGMASPLRAQEPLPATAEVATKETAWPKEGPIRPQEEARQRALKILKENPAFRTTEDVHVLKYEPSGREPHWLRRLLEALFGKEDDKPQAKDPNSDFLKGVWELMALLGKVLLVGGLLAFLLWLVYRFRHRLGLPLTMKAEWEAPEAVAGLDVRPESLPPDVPEAARNLFVRGETRAALALLYRGALAELIHRKGVEIPASATEGDCLLAAGSHLDPEAAGTFKVLTTCWQRLAYKDEAPGRDHFERLCEAWPGAFRGRP
jgi:hypothetical protein